MAAGVLVLVGAFVLAVGAAGVATYWQQSGESAQLLAGLNAVRASTRAIYNSKTGYGLDGSAIDLWADGAQPAGWSIAGKAVRHNQGGSVDVRSNVTGFTVTMSSLSPIACWQLLPRLDSGWTRVRYNDQPIAIPPGHADIWATCGYIKSGTLELTSAS